MVAKQAESHKKPPYLHKTKNKMNNETHPEAVPDLRAGTPVCSQNGDLTVTIRGATRGITGFRITIDDGEVEQRYVFGRFSSEALSEGVDQSTGIITPMATMQSGLDGPEPSETNTPQKGGPLDPEQRGDTTQRAPLGISTELHAPSDGGLALHRGEGISLDEGPVPSGEEEGTYPDWVVAMFRTMSKGDRNEGK